MPLARVHGPQATRAARLGTQGTPPACAPPRGCTPVCAPRQNAVFLYSYESVSPDRDDHLRPLPRRTAAELRAAAIGPATREALSLALWEAYRLRNLARTLHTILTSGRPGTLQDTIHRAVARLDQEPCIAEGKYVDLKKLRQEENKSGDHARQRLAQLAQERADTDNG